jgi:hypothetical protein
MESNKKIDSNDKNNGNYELEYNIDNDENYENYMEYFYDDYYNYLDGDDDDDDDDDGNVNDNIENNNNSKDDNKVSENGEGNKANGCNSNNVDTLPTCMSIQEKHLRRNKYFLELINPKLVRCICGKQIKLDRAYREKNLNWYEYLFYNFL